MKKYSIRLLCALVGWCMTMLAGAQNIVPPKQLMLDDMAATMRAQPLPNGGSLQRITLPADLIMHSQTPDLADLRLFNSKGEVVPFALRSTATEATATTAGKVALKAFPIRDSGRAVAAGRATVRVESRGDEMDVLIDRTVGSKTDTATQGATVAVLLDTRAIEGVITAIEFDMDLPANQVIPITIETTRNFLNWDVMASAQSVYRFSASGDTANSSAPALTALELPRGTAIKGNYLRISWPLQKNPNAIVVRGAMITTKSSSRTPIAQPKRNLGAPTAATTHALEWQLASPLRLRTLMLTTEQTGTLLPIAVLGRDNDKQAWRRIGETVVFRLETVNAVTGKPITSVNAPLRLDGVSARQLRIEVPANSAGIAANLIAAAVEYDGQEIIAAIKPADEMMVAVGYLNAPSVALPMQTIVPDANTLKIERLPLMAIVEPAKFYPERLVQATARPAADRKNFILWGVLLLGVGVLAAMAWGTVRQLQAGKT